VGDLNSKGYHIHIYCEVQEIGACKAVRAKMLSELNLISGAGPVRSGPVGPHPLPMFEAWFDSEHLDRVVRWVMKNRNGFSVLIHPLTGDDLSDHRDHAMWLGRPLPLDLSVFNVP